MYWEMDFNGSAISEIVTEPLVLEIRFSEAHLLKKEGVNELRFFAPALMKIGHPKFKRLPSKGRLTDGELYGVPGKPLNGRLPIDLLLKRPCELTLSVEDEEFTIHGKSFHLVVDLKAAKESGLS